jgi:hypothetical protein
METREREVSLFKRIRMWRKTQVFLNDFGPDVVEACKDGLSREDEIMAALKSWNRERSEILPCRLELILRQMAERGLYAMEHRTAESFCLPTDGGPGCTLPWRQGKAFSALPPALKKMAREYERDAKKLSASADAARHWSAVFDKRRKKA